MNCGGLLEGAAMAKVRSETSEDGEGHPSGKARSHGATLEALSTHVQGRILQGKSFNSRDSGWPEFDGQSARGVASSGRVVGRQEEMRSRGPPP